MNIRMQYMIEEAHSFYGYGRQYIYGDIPIHGIAEHEKGILLELKGKVCRQLKRFKGAETYLVRFLPDGKRNGAVFSGSILRSTTVPNFKYPGTCRKMPPG